MLPLRSSGTTLIGVVVVDSCHGGPLPPTYALEPPDGHALALTLECFNSVDGSVPIYALVGWFRFVCAISGRRSTADARQGPGYGR